MTDRELMQQALEALNHVNVQDRMQIITALRSRLAQPEQEQEPVVVWKAWECKPEGLKPLTHEQFFRWYAGQAAHGIGEKPDAA